MSERFVHVTVTVPMGSNDACDVASVVGDVREALGTAARFRACHAGKLVGLVGEGADPAEDTYRHPLRMPS